MSIKNIRNDYDKQIEAYTNKDSYCVNIESTPTATHIIQPGQTLNLSEVEHTQTTSSYPISSEDWDIQRDGRSKRMSIFFGCVKRELFGGK